MNKPLVIGVDIDGVLVDTSPHDFLTFCDEQLGWSVDFELFNKTHAWQQGTKGKSEEQIGDAFEKFLTTVEDVQKPIEGAHDALKELSKQHEIFLITARTGVLREITERFLREHLSDVNHQELSMDNLENKARRVIEYNVNYFIDDSFREISLILSDPSIQTKIIPFPSFFGPERWRQVVDDRIHWLEVWQEVRERLAAPQQVAIRKKAWEEIVALMNQ